MSAQRRFCIHGHFYQPPREDPWLGRILIESSAAPMRHWNERIVAESYGPMGWAHRVGENGKIIEICNCYEWISFNVGPTLLAWLERKRPDVYARILEADAASLARWGHGNAMAQVYHHIILPLASPLDKELETAWAVADFEARFRRKPEGMWLAESAVDTETLEALAAADVKFVILAPRQAKAVAGPDGNFVPVDGTFDVTRPYRVELPSGASMAVFFYDGPLSQAVAFERLLENGDNFWNRINQAATGGLLTLATDGETYGHHFPFGEMALAYVLSLGRGERDDLGLTNPGAFLEANPPTHLAVLHEPSSWSCAHGVERWRSDCGCKDGGHPDWNQQWRGPLRAALSEAKAALDEHFFARGKEYFVDARKALVDFGRVLADRSAVEAYAAEHIKTGEADIAWKLLTMQEQALASFASCAWFFDDISRIEPVNAMTFMWRALQLARETGGPDLREAFSAALGKARSNKPEEGSGADILKNRMMPREQDDASLCLLALLLLDMEDNLPGPGGEADFSWPAFSVRVRVDAKQDGAVRFITGQAFLGTPLEKAGKAFSWTWHVPDRNGSRPEFGVLEASSLTIDLNGITVTRTVGELPRHVREYLALCLVERRKRRSHDDAMASARHLLSLIEPWEEAQNSMPYAWDWTPLVPYILAACVLDATASAEKREQAVVFCQSLGTPASMRAMAAKMIEEALVQGLRQERPDWPRLTGWVERAGKYLPEVNLWEAQNLFAHRKDDGQDKEAFGGILGFAQRKSEVGRL